MLVLLVCVSVYVSLVHGKYNFDLSKATTDATTVESLNVSLPVDHFSNNTKTFLNRYWVNDEFYKDGGPVMRK